MITMKWIDLRYLSEQVDNKGMYSKLGRINGIPPPDCTDPAFEATAAAYLKVSLTYYR